MKHYPKPAHAATTFVVNSTGDSGDNDTTDNKCFTGNLIPIEVVGGLFRLAEECTLRAAIQQANATTGADTINFAIPDLDSGYDSATGVFTIKPVSALPQIHRVTIDGYSQSGATPNTLAVGDNAVLKIELSGVNAGASAIGLNTATNSNSTIKGLVINRWTSFGVVLDLGGGKLEGSFIGTDASGTQDLGNNKGVAPGSATTIGGTEAGARNIISGNNDDGVLITSSALPFDQNIKIMGNYIGTDASGTQDLGNSSNGVFISGQGTTVGGTEAGARNVISGNDQNGVSISDTGSGNVVQGNYIGTDKNGTGDLGNSSNGVRIFNTFNNTVGGTEAGARNIISGNDIDGITISSSLGNRILGNSIFANAQLGIDLGDDGATANDLGTPPDADTGANNLQNYPEITSARPTRKHKKKLTTIRGNLVSTPSTTFTVQFFSNLLNDPNEGKTFIGQLTNVTTDANGVAVFSNSVARKKAPVGSAITATATDPDGNTSEFSDPRSVG